MRKTVSLSRAKIASKQNRAKKAVSVLRENFSEDVKISRELNESIWSRGIESPPAKVTVELEDGVLYPAETFEASTDNNDEEQEGSDPEEAEDNNSEDKEENDYSSLVDGTISDVKDRVTELESPDYEALIEAEESGKDRKTLKEWLENRD